MGRIAIEAVSKRFGAVEVLSALSLVVEDGEFVTFLGPSGCGKSTLLRMIAGLEAVDEGAISIGGRRVDHLPPGERGVAMVFQHYALYPHMTVAENVGFGLRNLSVPRAEIARRLAEAARMLEIEPLLERRPAQLSGGQRQRVAIARALVKEPQAFLLDEPLSNLDAALRLRTRVELAQLHRRTRATTIFVTHDQVEAMTLSDRIVVMHDRRVQQVGDPVEVYARPANVFVAQFVGSPAMNLLAAEAEPTASGVRLRIEGGPRDRPAGARARRPRAAGVPGRGRAARGREGGLRGTVEVVERLGDRSHLHLRLASGVLVVAEGDGLAPPRAGTALALALDPGRCHVFDEGGLGHHPEPARAAA